MIPAFEGSGGAAEAPQRRVVISGMGVITSLGSTPGELWDAVLAGRSGVGPISLFDADRFPVRIASEVPAAMLADTDPRLPRAIRLGCLASDSAWQAAGIGGGRFDPTRAGVCVGASCFPIIEDWMQGMHQLLGSGRFNPLAYADRLRARPELIAQQDMAAVSSALSARYGLRGISVTVQAACTSATQAIGESFEMIRRGDADVMLTGGTDSLVSVICLSGFSLLGALSTRACDPAEASRPFDRDRDGFVLGEGAGIVVLEELEHALAREAPIEAEVIGYGSSLDGHRFTDMHPQGDGALRCMTAALASAGVTPAEVDYINAHGTSTMVNDRIETAAIKRTFGPHAYELAVSSTKSQIGHLICAAGGVELIVTALALGHGILPPTLNLDHPDPDCDLDYVPRTPRAARLEVAMSNSFGFGGQNGTVVLRKWKGR